MNKKIILIAFIMLAGLGAFIYFDKGQSIVKLILRLENNYQAPNYENDHSILAEVNDKNVYYDRLYKLKDYQSYGDFGQKSIMTLPFVHIYDRNKRTLSLASGSECGWSLMNFFIEGDSTGLSAGDSMLYPFIIERLIPVDIKKDQDTFDYYVMAGWANYAPRFADSIFTQTNRLQRLADKNFCLSYINLDFQEEWEAEIDSIQKAKKN